MKEVPNASIITKKVAENTSITRIQFNFPVADIQLFFNRIPIYAININGEKKSGVTYHRFGVAGATIPFVEGATSGTRRDSPVLPKPLAPAESILN